MSAAFALIDETRAYEPRAEAAAFVLALRTRGIADLSLLRAMETVPRELFAPRRYADLARHDIALPLPCGETMTAPTVVAVMVRALGVGSGQRILEIGTGSGYVTALLCALGGDVDSIERRPVLADSAWQRIKAAGFSERCGMDCRDGFADDGRETRYDRILVNGALAEGTVPESLTSLLAAGGRLVAGNRDASGSVRLMTVLCASEGELAVSMGAPIRLPAIS
ncbi:protein-L-isoaspartate O-methyltransferase family protein [Enterovirga rhinocerotis]|uniref:protein-L-isoaspartate O-methyltransferase family protein n=1 Tax=Enterovirga rhinocerotis TaxID=1339210 RepID=UPI001414FD7B|nr:protein-L-isoaspartate O-methyltransferase [Enterovirga rhinocerotis]